MHLGPDQHHGYVERLVGDHGSNYLGGSGVDRGILDGTAGPHRISLQRSGAGQSAYQVHDEYVTAAVVDFFNRAGAARRAGETDDPVNLSVGFMLPHAPFVARREDYALYAQTITLPAQAARLCRGDAPASSLVAPACRDRGRARSRGAAGAGSVLGSGYAL